MWSGSMSIVPPSIRHYDPPKFATVRKILRTRREIFASADEDERFTVLNLSVSRDSPDEFSIRINKDFAIDSNGNIMNDACLLVGEHGIDGFMALVDEVLDVLSFSHESYEALYNLFDATCGALGHRMMNYNKVAANYLFRLSVLIIRQSHGKKTRKTGCSMDTGVGRWEEHVKLQGREQGVWSRTFCASDSGDEACDYMPFDSDSESVWEYEPSWYSDSIKSTAGSHISQATRSASGSHEREGDDPKLPTLTIFQSQSTLHVPRAPGPKPGQNRARAHAAIERFPHPDPQRRKTWAEFEKISELDIRKCWRQVSLIPGTWRNLGIKNGGKFVRKLQSF
ncbi:hypothetical protein B0H11DRAFT_1944372 [Mycena galericulata]|nr:hypothetical protein B0H11DRAFT_1944372 [Mycena galericulata]